VTPFMHRVSELLDGAPVAAPSTTASEVRAVGRSIADQAAIRGLAEQLVSEANAVLRGRGCTVDLIDDSGPGELGFTLTVRDRSARVSTRLAGHRAVSRLVTADIPAGESRQLAGQQEVELLLLSLIAVPDSV